MNAIQPAVQLNSGASVADVAIDAPYSPVQPGVFSYALPLELQRQIGVGQLVWAPLRQQMALGVVMRLHGEPPPDVVLRSVQACVEPSFRLSDDQMTVAEWLAHETVCSIYAAMQPFFPPGVDHRAVEYLRLEDPENRSFDDLTPAQRNLMTLLSERGEVTIDAAREALGKRLTSVIPDLIERGVISRSVRVVDRMPTPKLERFVRLVDGPVPDLKRAPKQRQVVEFLQQRARLDGGNGHSPVALATVLRQSRSEMSAVNLLAKRGAVEIIELPRSAMADEWKRLASPVLTAEQAAAWNEIERALERGESGPLLVRGVTGSGKTELYLRGVAWCLRRGRAAIVLVPEIALASQVVRRFQERFPGQVAVMHSELSPAERYASWESVESGERKVVVGPRSALFAPAGDLGLIVLDEEHEGSYKQESDPRYHARALAEVIGRTRGATVLLGSATPSIETERRAATGEIREVLLRNRVGQDPGALDRSIEPPALALPDVDIIDMRLELHRGNTAIISRPMVELIQGALQRREQSILFLNRRGLATIVLCRSCGHSVDCPLCDIPLVYHGDKHSMICHRCNHREAPLQTCPECGGMLNYFGAGTQRVEADVRRLFPEASVLRWDRDSVRKMGGHERMLGRIERREVDIVVGTQMIAKGLDLPQVTAIGVIHADTMLHLPDFRSAERTFQLLTQVAGRAGRRTPGSKVIVQTYTPAHYAIQAASRHDYDRFYAEEVDFREQHFYPPFSRLIRFLFRHADDDRCAIEASEMAMLLGRHARSRQIRIDLLGPAPAYASRYRGKYQWQIILRAEPAALDALLDGLPRRSGWWVDVDPMSLL